MSPHPDRRASEAQRELSNFISTGLSQRDFVSLMAKDRRSLQAEFTKLCFAWIQRAALQYQDGDYDLRNEEECKKAFQMVKRQ